MHSVHKLVVEKVRDHDGDKAGILTGGNHLVCLERIGSSQYIRDRDEVGRFVLVFGHLRGNALGDDKSAALLARLVEETR